MKKLAISSWWDNLNPKHKMLIALGGGVVGIAVIVTLVLIIRQTNKPIECSSYSGDGACIVSVITPAGNASPAAGQPLPVVTPTPQPLVPNTLSGNLVQPGQENMRPLAVMIENHTQARPQSGLAQADLVYEAIAEGGITRFMAVFANADQTIKVGPIRSARTYFVDLATELGALYAHVGGNLDALNQISRTNVLDLNQFNIGSPVFQRDTSRKVALEHTMYSSTDKLWNYAITTRKYPSTANFQPWKFQDGLALENRPTEDTLKVSVSDPNFAVTWTYVPANNSYTRTMAGTPHKDANTGATITATSIITQTVSRTPTVTAINEKGWAYGMSSGGTATITQNGTTIKGTWKKSGGRTRYYNPDGTEIELVKGKIWVHIVHPDSSVIY